MLLSLVIPIYKVELYINDCLQSIISQLPEDVEVILVDDGSPDDSMRIARDVLASQPEWIRNQFVLYAQQNQGLSAARNSGIKIAKGSYLAFLDSDDIVFPNYFSHIITTIKQHNPDVMQFRFAHFSDNPDNLLPCKMETRTEGLYSLNNDILSNVFNDNAWFVWARVYRASLFKNISFPAGYNFEDIAVVPFLFLEAKTLYSSNEVLYGYRDRPNSITRALSDKVIKQNTKSLKYVVDLLLLNSKSNVLFFIPLVHFFRIYIDYLVRFEGVFPAFSAWRKTSIEVNKINAQGASITRKADKLFYTLYRFHFGFSSYVIVQLLSHSYGFINRFKRI